MTERGQTRRESPDDRSSHASSPPAPSRQADGADAAQDTDRRTNQRLRELVDEMLASVRVAVRRDLWTEAERAQCEQELADIMRRVRFEAVWKGGPRADQREPAGGTS